MMALPNTRGWQVNRSILNCHKYMLENQIACDIKLIFPDADGSSVMIPTHKYMLVCRSPVFEAMLSGSFRESSDSVTITDVQPDIFRIILRYMYHNEVFLSGDTVLFVLFAAKKYMLDSLVTLCVEMLLEKLYVDNVCTILNYGLMYEEAAIVNQCTKYVICHTTEVFRSEDFLQLSHNALNHLLQNDQVSLPAELDILQACIQWAKHQQEDILEKEPIRNILGNSIYQIRFASLTSKELSLWGSKVLTDTEQVQFSSVLSESINLKTPCSIEQNKNAKLCKMHLTSFNLRQRLRTSHHATIVRFGEVLKSIFKWNYNSDTADRISFKVTKPVLFRGVTVFGGYTYGDTHYVHIKLQKDVHVKQAIALRANCTNIESEGTSSPIEVLLKTPYHLQAHILYTVEVDMTGPPTYYGEYGKDSVLVDDFEVSFHTSLGNNNSTDVNRGQIPQLLLTSNTLG